MGVHVNIWGSIFYVKSIFWVFELDRNSVFWVHKEELWNLVQVSKILDTIFGVPKTLGLTFRGQQRNSGMDPHIESQGVPPFPWGRLKPCCEYVNSDIVVL